jgi:hypothetical protein
MKTAGIARPNAAPTATTTVAGTPARTVDIRDSSLIRGPAKAGAHQELIRRWMFDVIDDDMFGHDTARFETEAELFLQRRVIAHRTPKTRLSIETNWLMSVLLARRRSGRSVSNCRRNVVFTEAAACARTTTLEASVAATSSAHVPHSRPKECVRCLSIPGLDKNASTGYDKPAKRRELSPSEALHCHRDRQTIRRFAKMLTISLFEVVSFVSKRNPDLCLRAGGNGSRHDTAT